MAHDVSAHLLPDARRVIARLFLPGEERADETSRSADVIARLLALPEDEVQEVVSRLSEDFGHRHRDLPGILAGHAAMAGSRLPQEQVSPARQILIGAALTSEYAVEGAALCNPSAVPHPDQSGTQPGQLRVAVSVRGIGEGHFSTIGFAEAVIGPGESWSFEPRQLPAVTGTITAARWRREHLRAVLTDHRAVGGLSHGVLDGLPADFDATELQQVLARVHQDLRQRPGGTEAVALLRSVVASTYGVAFPADIAISQQVLVPSAEDESVGMEDARFVRFTDGDGTVDYRATYTAYDGSRIAPRLLTSPDLRTFHTHRLAGPAARNKGMALFPRPVDGRYLALCRSDGENNWIAGSADGLVWGDPVLVQQPRAVWESLQIGNCGPPIETDRGWLVLTHGVGPLRTYSIGAILLDLQRPERMVGWLDRPLLHASADERDGYVPNVVYSCGGLLHDGRLWVPYGVCDARIAVAWADIDELLDAMTTVGQSARPVGVTG